MAFLKQYQIQAFWIIMDQENLCLTFLAQLGSIKSKFELFWLRSDWAAHIEAVDSEWESRMGVELSCDECDFVEKSKISNAR